MLRIFIGEYMINTQQIFDLKLKYKKLMDAQSLYLQKYNDCKFNDPELANSYHRAAMNLNERIDNMKSLIDRVTNQY